MPRLSHGGEHAHCHPVGEAMPDDQGSDGDAFPGVCCCDSMGRYAVAPSLQPVPVPMPLVMVLSPPTAVLAAGSIIGPDRFLGPGHDPPAYLRYAHLVI